MDHNNQRDWYKTPARKTIRLTFKLSADGKVSLLSAERLNMICPPVIGDKPEKGKHGGFWMELLNNKNELLFHRPLSSPLLDSVEVHSPDGKIQRVFGGGERIFEVLVPDDENATHISLVGEELDQKKRKAKAAQGSTELARFEIPKGKEGGKQ